MRPESTTPRPDQIACRLRIAAGGHGASAVARQTGASRETARRYLATGQPSVSFLAEFCIAYDVNPAWILFGQDPQGLYTATQEQESARAYATADLLEELRRRLGEDFHAPAAPLRIDAQGGFSQTPSRQFPRVGSA